VPAAGAVHPRESMREDAAAQERAQVMLDDAWQAEAMRVLLSRVAEHALHVLTDGEVQHGRLSSPGHVPSREGSEGRVRMDHPKKHPHEGVRSTGSSWRDAPAPEPRAAAPAP
jgi:hypothetical protein